MKHVLFTNPDNSVVVMGVFNEDLLERDIACQLGESNNSAVQPGATVQVFESIEDLRAVLPATRVNRDAWRLKAGRVVVDPKKVRP